VLETAILTGEDKNKLTEEMRKIGESYGEKGGFFIRDSENVKNSIAVVLVGAKYETRRLGTLCGLCLFDGCSACTNAGGACVYPSMDLGIALGSAVAMAADHRIDNRIMFTIGKAAVSLKLLGEDYKMVMGIPLAVSGKSVFFDR